MVSPALPGILILVLEHSLAVNLGAESLQGFPHQLTAQFLLILGIHSGIAQRIRNRNCRNDSVGADCQRDRHNRTHVNHGNTMAFNFLNHRCTATRAGASGGGQDHGIDIVGQQILSDGFGELLGVGDSGAVANCGIPVIMQ